MSDARFVVAVTGLDFEARIAAGPGVRSVAGGGDHGGLEAALERELARGAAAIISFGISGGLVVEASAGTWLVADAVITRTARWPVGCRLGRGASAPIAGRNPGQRRRRGRDHRVHGGETRARADHRRVRRRHGVARCRRVRGPASLAVRGVPGDRRSFDAGARAGDVRRHAPRWHGQPARGAGIAFAYARPASAAGAQRAGHADRGPRAVTRPSTPWSGPGLPGFPTASGRRGVRTRTGPAAGARAESRGPSPHPPWHRAG